MEEIKKRDHQMFVKEAVRAQRIVLVLASLGFFALLGEGSHAWIPWEVSSVIMAGVVTWQGIAAYEKSITKRFHGQQFSNLWSACQDRIKRNKTALNSLRKGRVADMRELPATVDRLGDDLYVALRKADIVMYEAMRSESELQHVRTFTLPPLPDKHAQELLQVADRNIAEYNVQMSKVMSGVQRTEAQAVVFVTTLDSLRARMLSHITSSRDTVLDNAEFLTVVKEVKQQLDAIDKALDEIDSPMPTAPISKAEMAVAEADLRDHLSKATPPPVPTTEATRIAQNLGPDSDHGK